MTAESHECVVIGHVGIEVTNLVKSKKFYWIMLECLGFQIILDNGNAVGFSNQNFQVWLAKPEKTRVRRDSPVEDESIVADHLAILVSNNQAVDAVEKVMREHGFEPLFPCEEHPEFSPGYYAVSFTDPDNYVVEIYTRPKT